jgi:hypothetical protein
VPVKYDQWDRLDREGAYVHVPGVEPSQVSHLAKAYVRKRLGPEAKVVTASTPRGTYVAVVYVPTVVVAPEPRPEAPSRPLTKRDQLAEDRAARREREDRELEERNTAELRSTLKRVAEPSVETRSSSTATKNDKIVEALQEAFVRGDSAQERAELEDHLQRTLPEDVVVAVEAEDEPDDEPDDWDDVDEGVG